MTIMSGIGGAGLIDLPFLKMIMKEYEDIAIKVGDKDAIEILKI
jgi:hypothetical protein